uniref:Non-structural protein 3a n=1 Tax=Feline coronavirus TaxID=12663 RepID=C3S0R7_9ALPC|nr:non-structural protein 3a [Feline coronavirus]ACI13504.1 non-structural protein 3a [Feline coronavirus]ACI13591.1 non-structural protein 3a [Feline coronavirus]ACI13619.1 non-structural protein 3a [Feline coronavirus]
MDTVKSIGISVDAVLDELDTIAFAVTLKVVFTTGRLFVCIGFGDTFEEAEQKAYAKLQLDIEESPNHTTV